MTSRPSPAPHGAAPAAPLRRGAAPAAIACVSDDPTLVAALRVAVPQAQVIVAPPTSNALVELLLQGACGVVAVDVPALGGAAPTLLKHLARQFPDVAIIGVGDRHDEAAIAPLISSGAVYRFLHRPVSAARARVFVDAASRRHDERQAAAAAAAAHAPAPAPAPARARAAVRAQAPTPPALRARPSREWTGPRTGWALAVAVAALIALAIAVAVTVAGGPTAGRAALPAPPSTAPAAPPATLPEPPPAVAAPASERAAPARRPGDARTRPKAPVGATTPATRRALVRTASARPEYPEVARDAGLEGWVDVHYTVNATGVPQDVTVTGADPRGVFEEAAIEAVRRWRYAPPAAPTPVNHRVRFRLPSAPADDAGRRAR